MSRLGAITITNAFDVIANGTIDAASFVQSAGTGTTTFNGAQVYTALAGLNVRTGSIVLNNTVDTLDASVSGTVILNATNTLTINVDGDITSDGAVTFTGGGGIFTAGNVTETTSDAVVYASNTTLTGDVVITTNGGNIEFSGTLNNQGTPAKNLTMTAVTGDITFTGSVGGSSSLGTVTVNSARTINSAAFRAESLLLIAPSVSATISGNLNLTTSLVVNSGAYNVSILGLVNSVAGATVFNNTGTLQIGTTAANLTESTFIGGIEATLPSSVSLNGTITTLDITDINLGAVAVVLQSATILNSNNGNITLGGTLNSRNAITQQPLTLIAGVGDISFVSAVGSVFRLGAVTVTSAATVLASSTFTAESFTQTSGSVITTFSDRINLTRAFDFTGTALNINGLGANVVGSTALAGSLFGMNVTNTGLFTTAVGANLSVGNDFTQDGPGLNSIGGNVASTHDGIAFGAAVTLTNNVTMITSAGLGDDILFSDTVDGFQTLSLTAGLGDVHRCGW